MNTIISNAIDQALSKKGPCACIGPGSTGMCPCGILFDYKRSKDGVVTPNPSVPTQPVSDVFTTKNRFTIRVKRKDRPNA